MNSTAQCFREIKPDFLDKRWEQGFEIYHKVGEGDDAEFHKFSEYTPGNHEKISRLMGTVDYQHAAFFIHENDLLRYYKQVVVQSLIDSLQVEKKPVTGKIRDIYLVARSILKEYFVNIDSSRILRALNDLVELIEQYMSKESPGFMETYLVTEKDHSTYTHCANVGLYCMNLGVKVKMRPDVVRELGLGGMLFDVGKKEVSYEILAKGAKLSEAEFKLIRRHPAAGRKILNDMKCYPDSILRMAAEHHEKFSGEGYPLELAGEKISPFARICSIMDVFDALTCKRSYREPLQPVKALMMMRDGMPGAFDQKMFVNFLKTLSPKS
jgi:HD-GYP domain-containing protein (c-di-GMP phosphodiesterase class II)